MASTSRSEITRRQLCLAAEVLVATQGITVATLRNVAQKAGQRNTAAVSYHFGTIEELLRAVVDMRLRDSEPDRQRMIAETGTPVKEMEAFQAWRCLTRPYFLLADEQAPRAHVRFLMHMSAAGLLSDPFDASIERPGAPSVVALLERLHAALAPLQPQLARARISLASMMVWHAAALHDARGFDHATPPLGVEALLADVETHVRAMLTLPPEAAGSQRPFQSN